MTTLEIQALAWDRLTEHKKTMTTLEIQALACDRLTENKKQ